MTFGILVEPEECYQRRIYEQRQRQAQEARQRFAKMNDLVTDLIFEAVGERGDEPVRITTVVNVVARKLNYSTYQDKVAAKLRLFRNVGALIKFGRLERTRRYFVGIPQTDAKYQAYLAAVDAMSRNLPEPRL